MSSLRAIRPTLPKSSPRLYPLPRSRTPFHSILPVIAVQLQFPAVAGVRLASLSPTNAARPSSTFSRTTTQSSHNTTIKPSQSRTAQIARHFSGSHSLNSPSPSSLPAGIDSTKMAPQYTVRKIGAANTLEHRVYIEKDGVPVSPFHDIPLYANEQQTILNMVVEIPRWTNGKLEVCLISLCFLRFINLIFTTPHHTAFASKNHADNTPLDLQGGDPQPH